MSDPKDESPGDRLKRQVSEMKDKFDEQARCVVLGLNKRKTWDDWAKDEPGVVVIMENAVGAIATAIRSAAQSGRARAEAIEDALRELLVCHAEGGFIEPGTDVLSEAWDALNLLPTNDAAIAKALDVSDE